MGVVYNGVELIFVNGDNDVGDLTNRQQIESDFIKPGSACEHRSFCKWESEKERGEIRNFSIIGANDKFDNRKIAMVM